MTLGWLQCHPEAGSSWPSWPDASYFPPLHKSEKSESGAPASGVSNSPIVAICTPVDVPLVFRVEG